MGFSVALKDRGHSPAFHLLRYGQARPQIEKSGQYVGLHIGRSVEVPSFVTNAAWHNDC
jgi:hypothetical protein